MAEVPDPSSNQEDPDVSLAQQALSAECNGILVDGVFDEYVASSNSSDSYALAKAFCKEVHDTASGGGGGGVDLAVFSINVSGGGSTTSWDKFCESYSESSTSSEVTNLMTRTVNPAILEAWTECMTDGGGLACAHEPGTNIIGLTWEEVANTGELRNTTLTTTNMTVQNPSDVRPTLFIGDTNLAFTVPNTAASSTFVLNGRTSSNFAQSCKVFVKSPAEIRAEIRGAWADLYTYYKSMQTNLLGVKASVHAPTYDAIFNALDAKRRAVLAKRDACDNGGTCSKPPLGNDFKYSYVLPSKKCYFLTVVAQAHERNILEHSSTFEAKVAQDRTARLKPLLDACP